MAFANSSKAALSFVPETTWGTTPTTPNFTFLRYNSDSWKADTTSVKSAELTVSREIPDIIRTQIRASGTVNFELSAGNLDILMQGLMGGTWTTNVLKVGTTRQSYAIERGFTDINQYELYNGCIPSAMTINVQIGKVIDGTMSFVAKAPVVSGATAASSTTPASTNSVMNPIDSVQLIQEGGAGSVTGCTGFTMNLQSQVIDFSQLANVNPADLQQGQLIASGTLDLYWQDATYITKYLGWTTTSLQFKLGGSGSSNYAFLFSKVKLSMAETDNGGVNQPLITKMQWQAFKDPTTSTLQITRVP